MSAQIETINANADKQANEIEMLKNTPARANSISGESNHVRESGLKPLGGIVPTDENDDEYLRELVAEYNRPPRDSTIRRDSFIAKADLDEEHTKSPQD